jgi:hypothetical protein
MLVFNIGRMSPSTIVFYVFIVALLTKTSFSFTAGLHPKSTRQSKKVLFGTIDDSSSGSEDSNIPFSTSSKPKQDWFEAELTLRNSPKGGPTPELDPEFVARWCCRSLQFVDYPTERAGLKRCFPFFTLLCRGTVTGRKGGDTVEKFCEHGGLAPALQPFMGASRIEIGEGTLSKAPDSIFVRRGDIMSFPVTIYGADVLAFQHSSGLLRDDVGQAPPVTNMVVRLEKACRPPYEGCWQVKEVLDIRFAFAGDMGNGASMFM